MHVKVNKPTVRGVYETFRAVMLTKSIGNGDSTRKVLCKQGSVSHENWVFHKT